jgi:hypothetical protein
VAEWLAELCKLLHQFESVGTSFDRRSYAKAVFFIVGEAFLSFREG